MAGGNTVNIHLNGKDNASDEILAVAAALNALKDKTVKVDVKVDDKELTKIDRALRDRSVRVKVDVDSGNLAMQLARIKDKNIKVNVDTGAGMAKIAAMEAALNKLDGKIIRISVLTDNDRSGIDRIARDMNDAGDDLDRSSKNYERSADAATDRIKRAREALDRVHGSDSAGGKDKIESPIDRDTTRSVNEFASQARDLNRVLSRLRQNARDFENRNFDAFTPTVRQGREQIEALALQAKWAKERARLNNAVKNTPPMESVDPGRRGIYDPKQFEKLEKDWEAIRKRAENIERLAGRDRYMSGRAAKQVADEARAMHDAAKAQREWAEARKKAGIGAKTNRDLFDARNAIPSSSDRGRAVSDEFYNREAQGLDRYSRSGMQAEAVAKRLIDAKRRLNDLESTPKDDINLSDAKKLNQEISREKMNIRDLFKEYKKLSRTTIDFDNFGNATRSAEKVSKDIAAARKRIEEGNNDTSGGASTSDFRRRMQQIRDEQRAVRDLQREYSRARGAAGNRNNLINDDGSQLPRGSSADGDSGRGGWTQRIRDIQEARKLQRQYAREAERAGRVDGSNRESSGRLSQSVDKIRDGYRRASTSVNNFGREVRRNMDNDRVSRTARAADGLSRGLANATRRIPLVGGLFSGFAGLSRLVSNGGRAISAIGSTLEGMSASGSAVGKTLGAIGKVVGPLGTVAGVAGSAAIGVAAIGTAGVLMSTAVVAGTYAAQVALGAVAGIAGTAAAAIGIGMAAGVGYFAAKAPMVSEAWGTVSDKITGDMETMAAVAAPAMTRMINSLGEGFNTLAPSISRVSEGAGQLMDNVANKMPSIAKSLGPMLEQSFATGATHANNLLNAMPSIANGVTSMMESLNSPAMNQASQTFFSQTVPSMLSGVGKAADLAAQGWNNMNKFMSTDPGMQQFGDGVGQMIDNFKNQDWTGVNSAIGQVAGSFGNFLGSIDTGAVAGGIENIAGTITNLNNVASSVNLAGMFEGVTGAAEVTTGAIDAAVSAISDGLNKINDLTKDNAEDTGLIEDAGKGTLEDFGSILSGLGNLVFNPTGTDFGQRLQELFGGDTPMPDSIPAPQVEVPTVPPPELPAGLTIPAPTIDTPEVPSLDLGDGQVVDIQYNAIVPALEGAPELQGVLEYLAVYPPPADAPDVEGVIKYLMGETETPPTPEDLIGTIKYLAENPDIPGAPELLGRLSWVMESIPQPQVDPATGQITYTIAGLPAVNIPDENAAVNYVAQLLSDITPENKQALIDYATGKIDTPPDLSAQGTVDYVPGAITEPSIPPVETTVNLSSGPVTIPPVQADGAVNLSVNIPAIPPVTANGTVNWNVTPPPPPSVTANGTVNWNVTPITAPSVPTATGTVTYTVSPITAPAAPPANGTATYTVQPITPPATPPATGSAHYVVTADPIPSFPNTSSTHTIRVVTVGSGPGGSGGGGGGGRAGYPFGASIFGDGSPQSFGAGGGRNVSSNATKIVTDSGRNVGESFQGGLDSTRDKIQASANNMVNDVMNILSEKDLEGAADKSTEGISDSFDKAGKKSKDSMKDASDGISSEVDKADKKLKDWSKAPYAWTHGKDMSKYIGKSTAEMTGAIDEASGEISKSSGTISKNIENISNSIATADKTAAQSAGGFENLSDGISNVANVAGAEFGKIFEGINPPSGEQLIGAANEIGSGIAQALAGDPSALMKTMDKYSSQIGGTFDKISGRVQNAFGLVGSAISDVVNSGVNNFNKLTEGVSNVLGVANSEFGKIFEGMSVPSGEQLIGAAQEIGDGITKALAGDEKPLSDTLNGYASTIGTALGQISGRTQNAFSALDSAMEKNLPGYSDAKAQAQGMMRGLNDGVAKANSDFNSAMAPVREAFNSATKPAVDAFNSATAPIRDAIGNAVAQGTAQLASMGITLPPIEPPKMPPMAQGVIDNFNASFQSGMQGEIKIGSKIEDPAAPAIPRLPEVQIASKVEPPQVPTIPDSSSTHRINVVVTGNKTTSVGGKAAAGMPFGAALFGEGNSLMAGAGGSGVSIEGNVMNVITASGAAISMAFADGLSSNHAAIKQAAISNISTYASSLTGGISGLSGGLFSGLSGLFSGLGSWLSNLFSGLFGGINAGMVEYGSNWIDRIYGYDIQSAAYNKGKETALGFADGMASQYGNLTTEMERQGINVLTGAQRKITFPDSNLNGFNFGFNFGNSGLSSLSGLSGLSGLISSLMGMGAGSNVAGTNYYYYHYETQNNHFDGGLVGDPESQARKVLDVLETSPSTRRIRRVLGN